MLETSIVISHDLMNFNYHSNPNTHADSVYRGAIFNIRFHRVSSSCILWYSYPFNPPRPTSAAFLGVFHEANSRQEIRFIRSNDIKSLNQITCLFSSVPTDHDIAAQEVRAEWPLFLLFISDASDSPRPLRTP